MLQCWSLTYWTAPSGCVLYWYIYIYIWYTTSTIKCCISWWCFIHDYFFVVLWNREFSAGNVKLTFFTGEGDYFYGEFKLGPFFGPRGRSRAPETAANTATSRILYQCWWLKCSTPLFFLQKHILVNKGDGFFADLSWCFPDWGYENSF